VVAALSMSDVRGVVHLWSQRRTEFWLSTAATAGVAVLGVLPGIGVAVALSILNVFRRAWWPYQAVLGRSRGVAGYHDVTRYPQARQMEGLVVFRFDAPLIFANARTFAEQVMALTSNGRRPRWVVIAAEPITDIDITAADMLVGLVDDLAAHGTHLVFAELKDPVRAKLDRYDLPTLDRITHFPTLNTAGKAYRAAFGTDWDDDPPTSD
jgi:MFS superfamily sulfate permease-like transporter